MRQQQQKVPVKVADIDNEMVERVMSSLLSSIHRHAIPSIATTLMEMDGSGVTVILPFSLIDIILAYNLSFGKLIHSMTYAHVTICYGKVLYYVYVPMM
jgi:hypothetical protein